jgi:hypothetical protein
VGKNKVLMMRRKDFLSAAAREGRPFPSGVAGDGIMLLKYGGGA